MSNLELKGGILELIARINDKESLTELASIIKEYVETHLIDTDFWNELGNEETDQLESAIQESEDKSNHIKHVEVIRKYKR